MFPKPTRKPRRHGHDDPVTADVRSSVLARDGGCVAALLDPGHVCRDRWGWPHTPHRVELMTLDHVQEAYGRMGRRAPSDPDHLVTLCWHAHLDGWATANRPTLREHLRRHRWKTSDPSPSSPPGAPSKDD
jgi:hypothetical protein